jgi:hypothetical protein
MRGKENGSAAGVVTQHPGQDRAEPGIQAALGLVEQQQAAGAHHDRGEQQPLPLPGGQGQRRGVGAFAQTEAFQPRPPPFTAANIGEYNAGTATMVTVITQPGGRPSTRS